MNKILATLFLTLGILINASAQIGAGRFYLGGAFGFSVNQTKAQSSGTSTQDGSSFNFGFYPNVGYFINDRVAIGAGVGYLSGFIGAATTSSAALYGVSPYIRKYFKIGEGQGNFFFFAQFSIDYGIGTTKNSTPLPTGGTFTTKNNVNSFGFGLSPGLSLFPVKNIGTEFTFGYIPFSVIDRQNYAFGFTSVTSKPDPNPTDAKSRINTFGLGFRSLIATSLTFKYYFGGKEKKTEKGRSQE